MSQHFDILIIDDEQIIVKATRKVFLLEGFTIDEATNVDNAIKKLQQNSYKLIISDLMLPRVTGIDLIKQVKISHPEIPVIIISGYAMVENAIQSFKAGAFDFIPKPFEVNELLGVVYRAMAHGAILRDLAQQKKKPPVISKKSSVDDKIGNYHFLGQHSWARLEAEGAVTIGVGETLSGRIASIQRIELPARYVDLWQGNLCARILSEQKLINMVWTPLSGRVIEINQDLEKNPDLIDSDPFGRGWLIKILPTNLEGELEKLSTN